MSMDEWGSRDGPPTGVKPRRKLWSLSVAVFGGLAALGASGAQAAITCTRTITADVVAIDMPIVNNRLARPT